MADSHVPSHWGKSIKLPDLLDELQESWAQSQSSPHHMHACMLSCLSRVSLQPLDCGLSGSSVHGDSPGKNTVSGLPCSPPGDFPDPNPHTPLKPPAWVGRFFTTSATGKPSSYHISSKYPSCHHHLTITGQHRHSGAGNSCLLTSSLVSPFLLLPVPPRHLGDKPTLHVHE